MSYQTHLYKITASLAAALLLGGCSARGGIDYDPWPREERRRYDHEVPRGHLPPPGACRIWYPDRPPGHQPPPGDCRELRHRVPPGARLIRG